MLILLWWSPEMRSFSNPFYGWPPEKKERVSLDIKHVLESVNILYVMAYWDLVMFKESKKISNDQELIQSDPTYCPQNQKGNN